MAYNRNDDRNLNSTRPYSSRDSYRSYDYGDNSSVGRSSAARPVRSGVNRASSTGRTSSGVRRTDSDRVSSSRTGASRTSTSRSVRSGSARPSTASDRSVRRTSSSDRASSGVRRTSGTRRPDSARRNTSNGRRMTKQEWMAKRRKKNAAKQYAIYAGVAIIVLLVFVLVVKLISKGVSGDKGIVKKAGNSTITEKLLPENTNNRPGQSLDKVNGIIIHSTGEAGKTAEQMYEYYVEIGKSGNTLESVHFIVGLNGEIIQTIPTDEIAFHALSMNGECIGIQYCQSGDDGEMTAETRAALVDLISSLCSKYGLSSSSVQRHYDIAGKICPQYYVDDSSRWTALLTDVDAAIKK